MRPGVIASPSPTGYDERRYRLVARLELAVSENGGEQTGLIFCRYPLYVTRTSPSVVALLQKCDGQRSLSEIARALGKKPAALLPALEGLHRKGILELIDDYPAGAGFTCDDSPLDLPPVSFIIPVRNRPALLRRCLQSILDLDY